MKLIRDSIVLKLHPPAISLASSPLPLWCPVGWEDCDCMETWCHWSILVIGLAGQYLVRSQSEWTHWMTLLVLACTILSIQGLVLLSTPDHIHTLHSQHTRLGIKTYRLSNAGSKPVKGKTISKFMVENVDVRSPVSCAW